MRKIASIVFITSLVFIGINSCKKDTPVIPDMGYNYFPDEAGHYIIYNVDSIYYDDFLGTVKKFKFQLKHKIESFYTDNEGRLTQRIERYVKMYDPLVPYDSMAWTLRDVWAANKFSTAAEQVEENVRFVKLAFPVTETQRWIGNAQNTLTKWNYDYNFIDKARTHGGKVYDSVLEVNQYDDKDLIFTQRQLYVERYARNVGMIYKRVIELETQPGKDTAGYDFTYTITTYGTE